MRATFAIYLEVSLVDRLPGFWEGIKGFDFCRGLDAGNFRCRREVERIEVEQVTEESLARVGLVLQRVAHQIFLPTLRRVLDQPLLTAERAARIAQMTVIRVEDAPQPKPHGLDGANMAVRCPICHASMKRKSGARGAFWGCSNFPECRGTRPISE